MYILTHTQSLSWELSKHKPVMKRNKPHVRSLFNYLLRRRRRSEVDRKQRFEGIPQGMLGVRVPPCSPDTDKGSPASGPEILTPWDIELMFVQKHCDL